MKIRITGRSVFSPLGQFSQGDILTDKRFPIAYLEHLVNDAQCAEFIDYETKLDKPLEIKKNDDTKGQSLPSSQPAKASQEKTRSTRTKKAKSSASTTPSD